MDQQDTYTVPGVAEKHFFRVTRGYLQNSILKRVLTVMPFQTRNSTVSQLHSSYRVYRSVHNTEVYCVVEHLAT
jgi:hypothetical protein